MNNMKNNLLVLFTIISVSCIGKIDCKKDTEFMANEECNIVVTSLPTTYSSFKVKGYSPLTRESIKYETSDRFWQLYTNEISIGDTLVKNKGSLVFSIHKKDTIINHTYKCYSEND